MARLVLFVLLAFMSSYEAYKILVVFPFPTKSHSILGDGVVNLLLKAGHEVTYMTVFPRKEVPPKLHQIDLSQNHIYLPRLYRMARLVLFVLLAFMSSYEAYKILVVFPFPTKSHSILGDGVVNLLLKAGHEVTYMTVFPRKEVPPKLHQIDLSQNHIYLPHNLTLKSALNKEPLPRSMTALLSQLLVMSEGTLTNINVQRLFNDTSQKFDAIIVEWMFGELYAGLSAFYECPFIWVSSVDPHWIVMRLIDEALHPAYHADAMNPIIAPFTFLQRVRELMTQISGRFMVDGYLYYYEKQLYNKIFRPLVARHGRSLPPYLDVKYNASLMLGNSHVSLGQAVRLPQSYKDIAGYHIDPKVKPLPEDLKKLLENSEHGLIYFSLGSNVKSNDMPVELKMSLLKMFSGLKYTVLWKFEEEFSDLPKNVRIVQWAPQTSILAHPKCILFITHGGLLSTIETVHFGVPIIGIPIFGDQFTNIKIAVRRGYAVQVSLSYEMADNLKAAIEKILGNPKYASNIKELSLIYHDRPVPPGVELVHWVEHVVKTRGAPHLRSPALMVPWYQKMYLDLLALIILVILVVKKVCKRVFCSKKIASEKKHN